MARHATFDPGLRTRIIDATCERVEKTPFLDTPFPHFLIEGFLPDAIYKRLHECFPKESSFEPFAYEKHQSKDGASNRFRFQTSNKKIDELSAESRTFWYSLRSALGSSELQQAVYRKLAPGLAFRYGIDENAVGKLKGHALPEVFRETDGYCIPPHPDTRKKVVTMQLALPTDDSQKSFGTEFYRRSLNPMSWLREPRGFETVKRMPFLPNTCYAFAVLNKITLKSWHGRTAIDGFLGIRHSLLNIWYEKAAHGCPDIVAENEQQHPAPRLMAA
jgi:hypothetical protein